MRRPGVSFTMPRSMRFSFISASRSASSSRQTAAASATRLAMISRSSTSRTSSAVSPVILRSAERVPITWPRWKRGTQTKESASSAPRLLVRLRKRGLLRMSQTTSALPVFATRPVTPSPMR